MSDPEPMTPGEGLAMALSLMAAWFAFRGDRDDDSDLERDDGWPEDEFRLVPWPPPPLTDVLAAFATAEQDIAAMGVP